MVAPRAVGVFLLHAQCDGVLDVGESYRGHTLAAALIHQCSCISFEPQYLSSSGTYLVFRTSSSHCFPSTLTVCYLKVAWNDRLLAIKPPELSCPKCISLLDLFCILVYYKKYLSIYLLSTATCNHCVSFPITILFRLSFRNGA